MTNFDALKQIYEALGGDEEITGTNLDALKAIATVAGSGGGGGGGLVVHGTEVEDKFVLDKTWQEIYDAASSGQSVVLSTADPAGVMYLIVCRAIPGNNYTASFVYENGMGELGCTTYECAEATGYPSADAD